MEQLQHRGAPLQAPVELEGHLRGATQPQTAPELALHVGRRRLEPLENLVAVVFAAQHAHEDAAVL